MGDALGDQGKHEEAEAMYREILAIQKRRKATDLTQDTTMNLAGALCAQGKPAEAEWSEGFCAVTDNDGSSRDACDGRPRCTLGGGSHELPMPSRTQREHGSW